MSLSKLDKALRAMEAVELDMHKALDALKYARKHNRGTGVTDARRHAEDIEAALESAHSDVLDEWHKLEPSQRPERPECKALERAEVII